MLCRCCRRQHFFAARPTTFNVLPVWACPSISKKVSFWPHGTCNTSSTKPGQPAMTRSWCVNVAPALVITIWFRICVHWLCFVRQDVRWSLMQPIVCSCRVVKVLPPGGKEKWCRYWQGRRLVPVCMEYLWKPIQILIMP